MTTLQLGDPAPAFSATAVGGEYGEGTLVTLESLKGKTVILYFYPRDDTPGCTKQACAIRDRYERFSKTGAVVFGVSIDSKESHAKFIAKHQLPFPLLCDDSHAIVEAYGVWIEKSMYGKKYMGTERSTFIIGPDGRIQAIHHKVKPDKHADIIIKDLARFEP